MLIDLDSKRHRRPRAGILALTLLTACGPATGDDPIETGTESEDGSATAPTVSAGPGDDTTTTGEPEETGETDDTSGTDSDTHEVPIDCDAEPTNHNVDILFMIDDSGSMSAKQHAIAANLDALVDVLDDANMNYRIAFTTSDNGNPLCPTNVKQPDSGRFVLESCRSRLEQFVFNTVPPVDAQQAACLDICDHDSIDIVPTATHLDPTARPRPWIQKIDGQTNLPQDVSVDEALRCFAPMGIAGCGYEEQLESVYRAILRSQTMGEEQYGFLRDDATVAVILVTDEADGSYNRSAGNPYDVDGSKIFWQDPNANFPTSAVSWNAGVECTGDGTPYDDCYAQHYDINGTVVSEAAAPTDAVFHPVSRYANQLGALPNVIVMGILGVPPGYEDGTPLVYRDAPEDPDFMYNFGIGPSCESPLMLPDVETFQPQAVPPVRQLDVAEAFPGRVYSICETDFAEVLTTIGCELRSH